MPDSCCAYGCTNRRVKGGKFQFFTFPMKDEELLKKWVNAVRRKNFKPSKFTRICSEHFRKEDYLERPNINFPRLKPSAIPSIFNAFPEHLKQVTKSRNPRKRPFDTSVEDICTSPHKKQKEDPVILMTRKIKTLQQKVRRKQKQINCLKDLVGVLRKKQLIDSDTSAAIENEFDGLTAEIFKNEIKNNKRKPSGNRYSREIKHFALTMYYYSPKAYNFTRSLLSLPHPSSVKNWISSVDAEPGFIPDVFKELSKLGPEDKECNLVFDSMAIRREIKWDVKRSQYVGFCDYGNKFSVEGSEVTATEALVFMLVSLKSKWKWPIGYFFVNKLKACVQVQLLRTALIMASEVGIKVRGITSDGTQANLQTMVQLGCDVYASNYESIRCYFKHPTEDYNVYFVPDACHNLKLSRNALGTYVSFLSENGEIQWSYIQRLNELQSSASMKLANKVSRVHIEWQKNPMKVKLAAQTLSSSVGDAISYLNQSNVPEFQDSEATVHFIKVIDRIFDFLNSRNPIATGYKKPIFSDNIEYLEESLVNDVNYLFSLREKSGQLLCHSRRKTFILGFATAVKSVLCIAKELLRPASTENHFKYILTYKFSQDHLEILFARIRRRFGCNNNPNVSLFVNAMKQMLQKITYQLLLQQISLL